MAPPRTLHIRCGTWEQVEAFYSRKLRRGRLLSMRVPFAPALGSEMTVGLELPNHEVMTIDGAVRKCEPGDGDARHWIEIELVGLSDERLRSLRDMVVLATSGRVVDSGISIIRGTDEVTPSAVTVGALQASAAPTVVGRHGLVGASGGGSPNDEAPGAEAGQGEAGRGGAAGGSSAAAAAPGSRTSTGTARTPLAPPVSEGGAPRAARATGPISPISSPPPSAATPATAYGLGASPPPSRDADEATASRAPRHPGIGDASSAATSDSAITGASTIDEDTASQAPRHPGLIPPASAGSIAAMVMPAALSVPRTGAEGELPDDERELFAALSGELRRLRQVAVHEVLSVSRDARAEEIRAGWMTHIRRFHPDVMARHRSDAVSHLAEELTILGNRAYDRLRVALVAEGRGAAFGPALFTPHGWLVGFDDLSTSDVPAARAFAARTASATMPAPATSSGAAVWSSGTRSGPSPLLPAGAAAGAGSGTAGATGTSTGASVAAIETGFEHVPSAASSRTGESFEAQARELLGSGDAASAREVLATALVVYPRSRPLRSLYYVASALTALSAGQVVLATSQLETALAHHEGCVEASLVLDQIHRNGGTDHEALRRLFQ